MTVTWESVRQRLSEVDEAEAAVVRHVFSYLEDSATRLNVLSSRATRVACKPNNIMRTYFRVAGYKTWWSPTRLNRALKILSKGGNGVELADEASFVRDLLFALRETK